MQLVYSILLPLVLGCLFIGIRRKQQLAFYLAATTPFLAIAIGCSVYRHDIYYYSHGPLLSAGFNSWALPAIVLSTITICAFRARPLPARSLQVLACLIMANIWLLFAGWIA